jgi:SAM-dependent methyltransferase
MGSGQEAHAARIIDLYQRHAVAWAADRGDYLFEKDWLDRFLDLMPQGGTILDLGCGSGVPIARYLIEHGCRVNGVDSSPAMIAMCADRFPDHEWRAADMRTLGLGSTFDGILVWDSFFHLTHDDQRRMFPIFRRHAAPGAALMFTSGPSAGEAIGSYRDEPLYHASLDSAEYRQLLDDNGFDVVRYIADDPDCTRHCVWLARARAAG